MRPAIATAAEKPEKPKRMLCINTNLGILDEHFYPKAVGRDFEITPYLEPIAAFRDRMTIVQGASHPRVSGGHSAEVSFLTAAPGCGTASFRNSISLDQYAAEQIGHLTRMPTLPLVVSKQGNQSLSFTSSGVMVPAERNPAEVFAKMFVQGDANTVKRKVHDLRLGRSILDTVAERAKQLKGKVGPADASRIDQYFESVREVEKRLVAAEKWEATPKPITDQKPPAENDYLIDRLDSMNRLILLALQSDSTRLISMLVKCDGFREKIPGVKTEAHNMSHHVGRKDILVELKNFQIAQFQSLAKLLSDLDAVSEEGESLLDRTQVLYGSNLGNGNNHDTRNLPTLLVGGGFGHAGHLAFDRKDNRPLADLYVSMLQQLGLETDRFASGTTTLTGLRIASKKNS
jgi:hypothetical protein